MARRILMNVADGDECRIAVIEDGRLFEYFVDRPSQLKHVGNIYKGMIQNVEPGIQAAFVDIGLERNGFLHVSDVLYAYENEPKLTDLFPRTLRIRESAAEDAVLAHHHDQDVEEVSDFVGDGHEAAQRQSNGDTSSNGDAKGNGTPREAEFLDKMNETQPGHRVTDSPLNVAPVKEQELPADSARNLPLSPAAGGSDLREDDEGEDDDTDQQPAAPPAPGQPAQLGPDGQPLRKRRRRGRRGGRRRREAREAAGQGAAVTQASAVTTPAPALEPVPAPVQPAASADPVEGAQSPPPASESAPGDKPANQRPRRRRLPKKRGGHLPKRLFEEGKPLPPEIAGEAPPEPDKPGMPGGDGSPPPNGPALRFHRGPLPKIQNLLKRNQEVVVQVSKASQGGKGPGLTSMISLPGRYMVLTPNSQRGGVSRKIEDGGARNELRSILDKLPVPEGMGVIIRTAAINRSFDDLQRDLNYLLRLWTVITTRVAEAPAPALLYSDSDPAIRTVRDYFTAETSELVIDDPVVYERVLGFFDQLMPSFKDRVKLYDKDVPLFFAEGIEGQIERIFDKKVPLKSGGYLFIEQTEALVSIDVNSGRFTSAGDAEKTAYLTNMEAIPEICRQLRLRDLAGIVCCDLIDMMQARHRTDVENALRRELRKDRARTKVARMSPFGVIEMTRQRVRPSIKTYTYVGCPTCNGFGMVHSAETMCLSLLRRMKLALCEDRVHELVVQVHPHVLSHLHSEFREDIDLLEEEFDKRILFEYARDLTLGQVRYFYLNDRQVRVVYDIDQRINTFVRGESDKVRSNVPLPVPTAGAQGTVFGGAEGDRRESKRRRRGGRRQRERDVERVQRQRNISDESQKAVSFGATLPELPPMEIIRAEPGTQQPDRQGRPDRRSRRDRDRGRSRRPEQQQSAQVAQPHHDTPPAQPAGEAAPQAPQPQNLRPAGDRNRGRGRGRRPQRAPRTTTASANPAPAAAVPQPAAAPPSAPSGDSKPSQAPAQKPEPKQAQKKPATRRATTARPAAKTAARKPASKPTAKPAAKPARKTATRKPPAKKKS